MNEGPFFKPELGDGHFCFGGFDVLSPICAEHCAVRLSCCVQSFRYQEDRFLDELFQLQDPGLMFQ